MRKRIGTLLLLLSGLVLLIAVLSLGFKTDLGPSPAAPSDVSEMPTPDLLIGTNSVATLYRFER